MLKVANMVGSGLLDIEKLSDEIGHPRARYDPGKYPGMYLRFEEEDPLITVYRTGKYIITGPTPEGDLFDIQEQFLELLSDMESWKTRLTRGSQFKTTFLLQILARR